MSLMSVLGRFLPIPGAVTLATRRLYDDIIRHFGFLKSAYTGGNYWVGRSRAFKLKLRESLGSCTCRQKNDRCEKDSFFVTRISPGRSRLSRVVALI